MPNGRYPELGSTGTNMKYDMGTQNMSTFEKSRYDNMKNKLLRELFYLLILCK